MDAPNPILGGQYPCELVKPKPGILLFLFCLAVHRKYPSAKLGVVGMGSWVGVVAGAVVLLFLAELNSCAFSTLGFRSLFGRRFRRFTGDMSIRVV